MAKNDIESKHVQVNGRRAHYYKAGSGPPVVLIHGGASDAQDWISTMTALSNRFSFYALDLLGYGKSEKDENGFYLAEFTEYLAGFINTLKLEKPALVGHSLGGRFCLDVAIKDQSKIGKLVLIDTTGLGNMSLFGNILQLLFWVIRKITRQPQPFPTFLMKPGEKFHRKFNKELRHLNIPTLLIWKELDPYLPVRIGRRAVKKIAGAKLMVLKGYGHAPHQKEKDRKAFYKILADFLDND